MLTRYAQKDLVWIDLVAPSPAEVKQLMQEFDLDPLVAEELLSRSFKPKVERFGELLYVILHFPTLRGLTPRPEQEIDFVIGKRFLITTRYETIDPLHAFARAFEVDSVLGRAHASHGGHIFVSMVQSLYQAMLNECDALSGRLKDIEERIFAGKEKQMVVELSLTSRTINDFQQSLLPHKDMITSIEPAAGPVLGREFGYHLRDLLGSYERVLGTLDNLRGALIEMRETNNSLLSTKQNEIMKVLTIMAFVTFPLTLISSVFGMNTENLPIVGLPGDFWIIFGGMVTLATSFFLFFKYKRWL